MAPSFDYGDEPAFLIVADDPAAAAAAEEAVTGSGARVLATVPLAEAAARLALQTRLDGLVIEFAGLDEDAVAVELPTVCEQARERHVRIVASLPADRLDAAWAALDDTTVYLTDPSLLDRVVAIAALLPLARSRFRDIGNEADERIRELSAEVARFAERLRQWTGAPAKERDVREPGREYRGETDPAPAINAAQVRAVIRARRLRATALPGDLFADPAWDMLLDLYAAHLERRSVSVSSLCIAAAVPGTTALRWIGTLIDAGLFERRADPDDRRRAYIELTPRALAGMAQYFASVAKAGLPPA